MQALILWISILNIIFLLMHEFDACYEGEWEMVGFLKRLPDRTQATVFLYAHLPICALIFYYLWHLFQFTGKPLWIFFNAFGIVHGLLHWKAKKWSSNVFHRFSSFLFIGGYGVMGLINLLLYRFY